MMKKIPAIILVLAICLAHTAEIAAGEYLTYQNITFRRAGQKLLRDFTDYDYNRAYAALSGRRFWGWRTHTVTNHEPVTFTQDTLYVVKNDGVTPITKDFTFKMTEQTSTQVSASGNIGIDASGDVRGFRTGLDAHVRPSISYERSTYIEENLDISITVDPATKLTIAVYGEGLVTNGVGRHYRFFRNTRSGGWEVFVLTAEYYSIEKESLE